MKLPATVVTGRGAEQPKEEAALMVSPSHTTLNVETEKLRPLRGALTDQLSLKRRAANGYHGGEQGLALLRRDIEALEDLLAQVDRMISALD